MEKFFYLLGYNFSKSSPQLVNDSAEYTYADFVCLGRNTFTFLMVLIGLIAVLLTTCLILQRKEDAEYARQCAEFRAKHPEMLEEELEKGE